MVVGNSLYYICIWSVLHVVDGRDLVNDARSYGEVHTMCAGNRCFQNILI